MQLLERILILSLSFLILSCGSNTTETVTTDSVQIDSTRNQTVSTSDLVLMVDDSSTLDTVPLSTSLIRQWSSSEQVKGDFTISQWMEIDSIKANGKYPAYLEKLDIGQTKDSRGWIYDTIPLAEGNAYVWGIWYTSYEACPYFSGKDIYLTTVSKEGKPVATIKLTKVSSGGDPPAFGSDWGACQIGEDFIMCKDTSMYGEYGDDGYDEMVLTPGSRLYQLASDGSIKEMDKKSGPEIKKRRKQNN